MQYKPWIIIDYWDLGKSLSPKLFYYSILLNINPFELTVQQFHSISEYFTYLTFPDKLPYCHSECYSRRSLPVFLLAQAIVIGDSSLRYQPSMKLVSLANGFLRIFYFINIELVTYFLGSSLKIAYLRELKYDENVAKVAHDILLTFLVSPILKI